MNGTARPSLSMSRRESVRRSISGLARTLSFRSSQSNSESQDVRENRTLFESFEWWTQSTPGNSHWKRLTQMLPFLKELGIWMIWLPPGCKAAHVGGNGYDIYDLYDLGEFDQKGSVSTKWGSRTELVNLCQTAKKLGVGIMWDTVLNHKAGADGMEETSAVKVDPQDRRKELTAPKDILAWTKFDFPGRAGKYSTKRWTSEDFTGVDYDAATQKPGVYRFGPWATDVDKEKGNYDYLMFADIDHKSPSAKEDILKWSSWITSELGLSGMRLDATKHYSTAFQVELVKNMQSQFGRDFFFVSEYWTWNSLTLSNMIGKFKGGVSLFDVQLVYNLSDFSLERRRSESPVHNDLRRIFEGSLLQMHPQRSVTFVANHDTQQGQSLEAVVAPWFVPHAYALILLRQEGIPCVFYGDVFGMNGPKPRPAAAGGKLPRMVSARQKYAYGKQKDYFDDKDCIGWTRFGAATKSDGAVLAVLLNSGWEARYKKMLVGVGHRDEIWTDVMGFNYGEVVIDQFGYGLFPVSARGISVWTSKSAKGRSQIDRLMWTEELDESAERL